MKEVLAQVDRKVLTIALKGTSEQLRNHFLEAMSQRGAEMLREDMEALGPIKIKEVEAAQQQIIAVVRQLESEGVISLKGAVGEQYVVLGSLQLRSKAAVQSPMHGRGRFTRGGPASSDGGRPRSQLSRQRQTPGTNRSAGSAARARSRRIVQSRTARAAGRQEGEAALRALARQSAFGGRSAEARAYRMKMLGVCGARVRNEAEEDVVQARRSRSRAGFFGAKWPSIPRRCSGWSWRRFRKAGCQEIASECGCIPDDVAAVQRVLAAASDSRNDRGRRGCPRRPRSG